jgi:hypothetical protein
VQGHPEYPRTSDIDAPLRAAIVSLLGIGISLAAGYVSLLYGGYSKQNREKADDIAESRGWADLLPSNNNSQGYGLNATAKRWARPCKPKEELAPVFKVFVVLATLSLVAHLVILEWSIGCCDDACSIEARSPHRVRGQSRIPCRCSTNSLSA